MPHDFPAWGTVSWYFSQWVQDDTLSYLHDTLRQRLRADSGRNPEPRARVIDSQPVKPSATRGCGL